MLRLLERGGWDSGVRIVLGLSASWRTNTCPEGLPAEQLTNDEIEILKTANKVTTNTFVIASAASAAGLPTTIENPKTSSMWYCQEFLEWSREYDAVPFTFDMCVFGTPYKKPTTIWATNGLDLSSLAISCNCNRKRHQTLSGWRRNKQDKQCVPSSQGAAYPKALAECWAQAVAQQVVPR